MPREDIVVYQHNLRLKKQFKDLGLQLESVLDFSPFDLDLENRRLENLLDFVKDYLNLGSQETMQSVYGEFITPPIFPGISPWSDWHRFERWVKGESVREAIINQFTIHEKFLPADQVNDEKIDSELSRLIDAIEATGNGVSLSSGIPARLAYRELMEWINEAHELSGPDGGGWYYDGCGGYCPGCFQRPWCESGNSSCWTEDEEAGKIHYIDELKPYVSASPQSFAIISKLQAEEDARFEKWKKENKHKKEGGPFLDHEGLRDYSGDGDLPF